MGTTLMTAVVHFKWNFFFGAAYISTRTEARTPRVLTEKVFFLRESQQDEWHEKTKSVESAKEKHMMIFRTK